MKIALQIVGVSVVLVGLLWIGQGSGYFPYPRSSFMVDQRPSMLRGAVLAAIGVIALMIARRAPPAR